MNQPLKTSVVVNNMILFTLVKQGLILFVHNKSYYRKNSFSAGTLVAGTHITALANRRNLGNVRC